MYLVNKTNEEVIEIVQADVVNGLTSNEVKERQKKGLNELEGKKPTPLYRKIFDLLNEPMTYILAAAAIISLLTHEVADAIIILIVVVLNTSIGLFQEGKAEKALETLKKLSSPKTLVKRDGIVVELDVKELVVGDLIVIEAGRYIPADLRLIEVANLKIDESILTGESVPVDKVAKALEGDEIGLGDRINQAYMSTYATYGRGLAVVIGIGMDTEIGKIATMLDSEKAKQTPLQQRLAKLGSQLALGAVGITILMFVVGIIRGHELIEMLMVAIALAVAIIPEGLPAIVTIVLALGVQRMIKIHAIVKKLPAVETLGSVNVICSDKTGTITQNKMTVVKSYVNEKLSDIESFDYQNNALFINGFVLCSDASNEGSRIGDPTELALVDMANLFEQKKSVLDQTFKRIDELPFDSERKMMSTVHQYNGKEIVFTKGAMDQILDRSTSILINGKVEPLANHRQNIEQAAHQMSNEALRVLGIAYKERDTHEFESNLIFIGLIGMIDPARPEVKDAVEICDTAGIRTVMITGDHPDTALAIAKEVGIAVSGDRVMSGAELSNMTQDQLNEIIEDYRVFARVQPEHKVMIVKALQSKQYIVSMTGDGVNDAPSLKAANIGVAMGITGSDVSKEAASMVLTDDNFATIVKAVEEGRNIFNNIKKTIYYLLSCNIGEVFALFFAVVLGWPVPLSPIHILWVNLVTDSFPALALGVDPGNKDVMKEKPRMQSESLFAHGGASYLFFNGVLVGTLTLTAFLYGSNLYGFGSIESMTMAFMVLSISQLFHSFNVRDFRKSIFKVGILTNKYLVGAFFLGLILQMSLLYIPFLASIFRVTPLNLMDLVVVFALSFSMIIFNEIYKAIRRQLEK